MFSGNAKKLKKKQMKVVLKNCITPKEKMQLTEIRRPARAFIYHLYILSNMLTSKEFFAYFTVT